MQTGKTIRFRSTLSALTALCATGRRGTGRKTHLRDFTNTTTVSQSCRLSSAPQLTCPPSLC
eukprot:4742905-Pleurochrysis_carterae.AAC.1